MRKLLSAILLALLAFAVYQDSPVITSSDSTWMVYTADSLLTEGDLDLDEYATFRKSVRAYGLRRRADGWYNFFPQGTALLTAPILAAIKSFPETSKSLLPRLTLSPEGSLDVPASRLELERIAAGVITALSVALFFLLAAELSPFAIALLMTILFAFCTPAWSTTSRGLWPHGASMLTITAALLLIVYGRSRPWCAALSGIPLAFSYLVRPTNAIAIALLTLYLLIYHRRIFLWFAAAALVVVIPFAVYNLELWGTFLPPYYRASRLALSETFLEALFANLISPSRGALIFSPFLVLALPGAWHAWRIRRIEPLFIFVAPIIPLHLIAVSLFPSWWGGHAYGPRYMSDVMPIFCVLLLPLLLSSGVRQRTTAVALAMFVLLTSSFSAFVHYRGGHSSAAHRWNRAPNSIDEDPSRVWSWGDPQFLRGLKFTNPGAK